MRWDLCELETSLSNAVGTLEEAIAIIKPAAADDAPLLWLYFSPKAAGAAVAAAAAKLAPHMLPDEFIGMNDWPRTTSGKVRRTTSEGVTAWARQ